MFLKALSSRACEAKSQVFDLQDQVPQAEVACRDLIGLGGQAAAIAVRGSKKELSFALLSRSFTSL